MPEHILVLINALESEMDRYWTRFNIFSGVQIAALFAAITNARLLVANKHILQVALVAMIVFSFFGGLVATRGWDLQNSLTKTILDFERRDVDSEYRVVQAVMDNYKIPMITNNMVCVVFAWLCCIFWTAAWYYLCLRNGYKSIVFPESESGDS